MLGILGGMGPLATIDFMSKVIAATHVQRDQEHIPTVVWSVPQIPDRTEAILGRGLDPLPDMLRGLIALERAGASLIAMPCNTAHHWYSQIEHFARIPVLNIVDACADELGDAVPLQSRIGLLATRGTIAAGVYQRRLADYEVVSPQPLDLDATMAGIASVKQGRLDEGRRLLQLAANNLFNSGCRSILMACTEIPIALATPAAEEPARFLDPTAALARLSVRRWQQESQHDRDYRFCSQITGRSASSEASGPGLQRAAR